MSEQKHVAHIELGRRVMLGMKEQMKEIRAFLDEYSSYYTASLTEDDFCTTVQQGDPPQEINQGAHCDIIKDPTRKDTFVNAVAVLQTIWSDWDTGQDTTIEKATR